MVHIRDELIYRPRRVIMIMTLFHGTIYTHSLDANIFLLKVASRVQKYFVRLAKEGLPIPGRMPNLASHTKKVTANDI